MDLAPLFSVHSLANNILCLWRIFAAKEGCGRKVALVERASFVVLIFVSSLPPAFVSLPNRGWASVCATSSHVAARRSMSFVHGMA